MEYCRKTQKNSNRLNVRATIQLSAPAQAHRAASRLPLEPLGGVNNPAREKTFSRIGKSLQTLQ